MPQHEDARNRRQVKLRLSDWHAASLALLAERAGVSMSELVQEWILREICVTDKLSRSAYK
jgi:hypothetical protein